MKEKAQDKKTGKGIKMLTEGFLIEGLKKDSYSSVDVLDTRWAKDA